MNSIPDTRASLIVRLPDASDAPAWREFADIYEPFVYHYARRRGLQDSDARELVQEVFLGVAKAIRRWRPDQNRAKFRTWLFRIARNQMLTILSKKNREHVGDSAAWSNLDGQLDAGQAALDEKEYRREVFRWASQRVQRRVHPTTWAAFWQSSVIGRPIDRVAESLQLDRGAVYVARSRVIRKLRDEIAQFENDPEHDDRS